MSASASEIQEILQTLETLQHRVEKIAVEMKPADPLPPTQSPMVGRESVVESAPKVRRASPGEDGMAFEMLRDGLQFLDSVTAVKEIPKFFARIADEAGLRLMLLKRWRSGLQVFQTEGISLPDEAFQKCPDGRAPIPLPDADVFSAIGEDRHVYAGPVPVKSFPLDLTLMLGRGSRDRQIVLIPLPAKDRWNTILYLDTDAGAGTFFSTVAVLARFALLRLRLLEIGAVGSGSLVRAILNEELARRSERKGNSSTKAVRPPMAGSSPTVASSAPAPSPAPQTSSATTRSVAVAEPVVAKAPWKAQIDDAQRVEMQTTEQAIEELYMAAVTPVAKPSGDSDRQHAGPPDRSAIVDPSLTPEALLRHSGELPALPRAACHIMAVIDDPRTTAPKLEKAIALDQALTAKVLRIANSPFYGAVRDIRTVSEAIVRLGFVVIRNWALVTATKSVFLTPGSGLLFQKIWRQSVMSAMTSQLVAQAVRHEEPDAVFLGGLMQNIGQLVLARAEPELFHQIVGESANTGRPYHVIERELLGFDHGEIGALLMKEWNLSADLEDAVRFHHRLDELSGENRGAAMIALGEELAAVSSGGANDDESFYESSVPAGYLGVSEEQYGILKGKAHQLVIDPKFFS